MRGTRGTPFQDPSKKRTNKTERKVIILLKTIQILLIGAYFVSAMQATATVLISSPSSGATVSSPVQLVASNQGPQPQSMSVYINNTQILRNQDVSSIKTGLNLNAGRYTIKVLAQYQNHRASTATAYVTVAAAAAPTPNPPPTHTSTPTPTPTPTPAPTPPAASGNSVAAQIAGDMQGKNEGYPHGVPLSYDWANGPVVTMGNNSNGWQAITSWGLVYEAAEGNPATNTRVNIRDMQTYFLQKSTGKWLLLQNTSAPTGSAYVEDFSGDSNKPADIRHESDGSISVTAGGGYNFHFYPADRASVNPNDIGGIVVVLAARLIVGDSSKADDRSSARYLCGAGADYYPALTGGWPGNSSANPGVANGKLKYVQTEWRSYAMTTMSQSQLEGNPPPVNLSGIQP
jgi:hypothetical protein